MTYLFKFGEAVVLTSEDFHSYDSVMSDPEIINRFEKIAKDLKTIAPRAKDFLYFSAVMMHAAEAALLDDNGNFRKDAKGNPVVAHWEKNGESWKWVCSDLNLKPYKNSNCFLPETQILMKDGSSKNIEDIEVGDWVITHKNRPRKVVNKFVTPHNGPILELKISRNRPIFCTKEHPFYVAKQIGTDSNKWRAIHGGKINYQFVDADSLNVGDILLEPVLNFNSELKITLTQARALGLFCAEGNYRKDSAGNRTGLILTFSHEEYDTLAEEARKLFIEAFDNVQVNLYKPTPSNPHKCTLSISGKEISELFFKHVGEYSTEKKLSTELLFAPNDIRQQFLIGWLEGDGHVDKDSGKIIGTTASISLASQIRVMLNSLKVNNCLYKEHVEGHFIRDYFVEDSTAYRVKIPYNEAKQFIKQSNKLSFEKNVKEVFKDVIKDNYSLKPLLEKNEVSYSGNVYNIEIEEDHSYVANDVIVHNCDIFPESELIKAHKEWVGKPLCLDHKSSSVDMIRGVIVDTYYDYPKKRVVALCALDKVTYPDLARKVETRTSTAVSMGTGVTAAICYDCGNVARVEADFCDHMRNKTCYGEINTGLKPLELSIVVNGADPKAKIKHIVASAADNIAKYIEAKESELKKLSDSHKQVDPDTISSIKQDLEKAVERLNELENTAKEVEEIEKAEEEGTHAQEKSNDQNQAATIATSEMNEINIKLANISKDLDRLQKNVDKLSYSEDKNMVIGKTAYHQGGGGVNDPASLPYGQEDYKNNRDKQDKQMLGQMDTGPVDGMHPGYSSFGETEEARKRRLQRLAEEQEQRALRRQAIVEKAKANLKQAYYQGGEGPNDPKNLPYPKDDVPRDEDKQMVGQKPFPGVGDVEGLHPSPESADTKDELKRKQMLARAKLTAKFIKSAHPDGTDNKKDSRWQVYADNKLILTATVDELTSGKTDVLYESVANKDFGRKILQLLRTEDFNKAAKMLKKAQVAPAPAPAPEMPPLPESMPDALPEGAPMEDEPMDMGGTGDPKDELKDLLDVGENWLADMRQATEALTGEPGEEFDSLEEAAQELPKAAASALTKKVSSQKKVGAALANAFKKAEKDLADSLEELRMGQHIINNKNKVDPDKYNYALELTAESMDATKKVLATCHELAHDFVRYADSTKTLMKQANEMVKLNKKAQEVVSPLDVEREMLGDRAPAKPPAKPPAKAPAKAPAKPPVKTPAAEPTFEEMVKARESGGRFSQENELQRMLQSGTSGKTGEPVPPVPMESGAPGSLRLEPEQLADDMAYATMTMPGGAKVEGLTGDDLAKMKEANSKVELVVEADDFDLSTKEGRAAYREKLAQKGLKFSPVLQQAHPGGGETTELDTKPADDLAKVETLEEQHNKVMDVATAPPRVRAAAEEIQKLVIAGRINPETDFDALIANGLDSDAVKYWKQYWSQANAEGSQFATELVKEHQAKKAAVEKQAFEVKISRAYELAYDMVRRGMISDNKAAVSEQVKEIMSFDDKAFESMKRFVERQTATKQAMPRVGLLDVNNLPVLPQDNQKAHLVDELSEMFSNRNWKPRNF